MRVQGDRLGEAEERQGPAPRFWRSCCGRTSDLTVRLGHISKQGSAWLRWVLNQAAQTAKRSPDFAASYQIIARKRGKKIATIAIARKLLTRAWHLLSEVQSADASTPLRRP
jgi:hypothetical protein